MMTARFPEHRLARNVALRVQFEPDWPSQIRGHIAAGTPIPEEEGDLGRLGLDLRAMGIPTTSQTFAVCVGGDSMTGAGIHDGDVVILENRPAKPGEIVAVLLENEVTLKRYVVEAGRHLLRAENPNYDDIPLTELAKIQGVAVGLIRR